MTHRFPAHRRRGLTTLFIAGLMASAATAAYAQTPADPREARIAALEAEVQALADQITDLKASTAANVKDIRTVQAQAPVLTLPNGRPSFATADGKFSANLHAVLQFDAAEYSQHNVPAAQTDAHARDLNSGTNFRRARIGIDGKAFGNVDYNFLYDFGGSGAEDAGRIQELWLQYSGWKPFRFRIGAFAPSLGLEDAASTNGQPFVERPAAAEVNRSLAGGDYRTGAAVFANGDRWFASAAITGNLVSTLNTAASSFSAQNYDEQLGYTARVAGTPLKGYGWLVHVGANASYVDKPGDAGPSSSPRYPLQLRDRPELRVDGTRLVDTGAIDAKTAAAYGLELAGQYNNLFAQAEAFRYDIIRHAPAVGQTNPSFSGWYVEGSWIPTGEARKYNTATAAFDAPSVTHVFDPQKGQWGALELAARYSNLDLNYHVLSATAADRVRGGRQDIWTAGLNWYWNPDTRFVLDLQQVHIDRLNAAGAQIGQRYNALALRSQFAF